MAIVTNLTIDQGTDFEGIITLYDTNNTNLDLTNYSAESHIRRSYESTTASAIFAVTIPTPSNGNIYLNLSGNSSSTLKYGRYVYDVKLTNTSTGKVTRAIEGIVTITPSVTR